MSDAVRKEIGRQPAEAELAATTDGRWVLAMSRELPHPPERVWPRLTEPALLHTWSPVVPDRPLDSPGPARSRENPEDPWLDAEVLIADAPLELVHRWGDDLLRWTLTPTAAGCRLTLEHTFADRDGSAMYAAGWHICQASLAARLDGDDSPRVAGAAARDHGWAELRDAYATGGLISQDGV
ncbi:SRPBCC family protein [Actinoplanes sp. G11-F43]|uniref:SRPBCC family protein n=1 Tax=Actinoplanes sp. G11-F43 TaxID=3424130 RepID=UPI003D339036